MGKPREDDNRCEAMEDIMERPYIQRCPKPATVHTPDGDNYCADHEEWND